ncbi:MAG: hypothetical protein KGI08_03625 [Thaumarchaeota archaeon]|nr:hypothetical protein [Nitrososphaerota archaeon]
MTPEGMLFEYDCDIELMCAYQDLGYATEHIQNQDFENATAWVQMAIQSVDSVIRRTK